MKICTFLMVLLSFVLSAKAQLVINEGSNMNYSSAYDEDGEFPDWVEIHNAGATTINMAGYSLSDDLSVPQKWVFPAVNILPGEYRVVFCSGKDRKPLTGFTQVLYETNYNPVVGWNTHLLSTPFNWDGVSDLLINICSYTDGGYTVNSVFNQTSTAYHSTLFAYQDGSNAICDATSGTSVYQRPNLRINGLNIGSGSLQNSAYDYPAPYGNWYWAARHQMLIPAAELLAAGVLPGMINSLSFSVVSTDPGTVYDYLDISMKLVSLSDLPSTFEPAGANLHTNFKLSSSGETVYLFSPAQTMLSSLNVNAQGLDNSNGLFPDASSTDVLFQTGTPGISNNTSDTFNTYLLPPVFTVTSGVFVSSFSVSIINPNTIASVIRYTTDGTDPTPASPVFSAPLNINSTTVLKSAVFANGYLQSPMTAATYFFSLNHTTPVLSVITENDNLYGGSGIFDNWWADWEKNAYVELFDTLNQVVFSQSAGIQVDGGWGGSRSQPQHSFRIELDDPVLGEGPVYFQAYPEKQYRDKYSKFYLRNGSNMFLSFPYKDACQTRLMCEETMNYYSAMVPVSVYINGEYFGLYEMREKMDEEFFNETDNANEDSVSILSQSAWGGGILKAVSGSVDLFFDDYNQFLALNPSNPAFTQDANQYFDLDYYTDYIIAESWMGNTDWPWNNIKIYRSDVADAWRFCVIDLELALDPGGWSDCYDDHIGFMLGQSTGIPYINIWLQSIQNDEYRVYFINRFADLMNTSYLPERLTQVEGDMFSKMWPEMPAEYNRWGDPGNIPQQMADFYSRHQEFQYQLMLRNAVVRNDIENRFSMNGQVNTLLNVYPQQAGRIRINTIVPDSLPWLGVYFSGNPVTITAYPEPGYTFSHWISSLPVLSCDTLESIVLDIPADIDLTAVFLPDTDAGKIIVSELNYHSDSTLNTGDWIELFNVGNRPVDLSGWKLNDGLPYHKYIIPNGVIVDPGERIVLAQDSSLFHIFWPSIPCIGPIGFGFSNGGEMIVISDTNELPMIQVNYSDAHPWPVEADGLGHTLELKSDSCNPSLPSSWFAGCVGGSPGSPWTPCLNDIIISEINYRSADTSDAGDWIELYNPSSIQLDISGWTFSDEDDMHLFVLPAGTVLQAGERIVLAGDLTKFATQHPAVVSVEGPFSFGLSSGGEALRLFDQLGVIRQSMVYGVTTPWPLGAAGNGYTLELLNPAGYLCEAENWINGCPGGSPSTQLIWPCWPGSINEMDQDLTTVLFYPNPTSGEFDIRLPADWVDGPVHVDIKNTDAVSVFSADFISVGHLVGVNPGTLYAGTYLVQIVNHSQMIQEKLVIIRP